MDIHSYIFNKWMIRHGYYMDNSTRAFRFLSKESKNVFGNQEKILSDTNNLIRFFSRHQEYLSFRKRIFNKIKDIFFVIHKFFEDKKKLF